MIRYVFFDVVACGLIVLVTLGACRLSLRREREMIQERRRLEYVLREYNRAFNDDYNPFEKWSF